MAASLNPQISIRGMREQDIDLLLLEEFVASKVFRAWFFNKLKINPLAELIHAERSVLTPNGETDIELKLLFKGETIKVLIENKVDAVLQPNQADRYRQRAEQYGGRKVIVVVAPVKYFRPNEPHGYDFHVTYESILSWFDTARFLGDRRVYKLAALRQAIERAKHGWQSVPDARTTDFWQQYWETVGRIAPTLRMPRPEPKPARSSFIRFRPLTLGADVELLHKVRHGRVDLQIGGMGGNLMLIEEKFGKHMTGDMRVEKASKSAVIRIHVKKIDVKLPYDQSKQAVEEALNAALALLRAYENLQAG